MWSSGPREVLGWDLHWGDVLLQGPVESETRARVGTQGAAGPGQDGSNVPEHSKWGNSNAGETPSLGTPQQTGQITPHAHRPQKGGVPVSFWVREGSGVCSPWCPEPWPVQLSASLPQSWHSVPGEEDETHQMPLVLPPLTATWL